MKILVDIDGTICESAEGKYDTASPVPQHIEKINKLYEDGNTIIYYSARGRRSGQDYTELTVNQLNDWGCKFHGVIMNHKLDYDLMICDKTKRIEEI